MVKSIIFEHIQNLILKTSVSISQYTISNVQQKYTRDRAKKGKNTLWWFKEENLGCTSGLSDQLKQQWFRDPQLDNLSTVREILEHSVLNGMQISRLKVLGSTKKRRQKSCKSWRWWIAPRKQCLLEKTGLILTWTQRDYGITPKTCTDSEWWKYIPRRSRNKVSDFPNKLLQFRSAGKEGESDFLQWHEVGYINQTPDRSRNGWPIQNVLHSSVCFWFYFH